VYLGPLRTSAMQTSNGLGDVRPTTVFLTAVKNAAGRLMNDSATNWAVFSPTDNIAREVVSAYVDDAFDTQRRRGASPLSRLTVNQAAV